LEMSKPLLNRYRANLIEKVKIFFFFQPVSMEEVWVYPTRSCRSYQASVLAAKALLYTNRAQPIVRRKRLSCSVVG
jgi:hypothetical protein